MTSYSADGGLRPADPQARLRLAALIAVIAGVILLAAAAFVLSYEGIHHLALRAGVSAQLARLYPVIFDAMMVIAAAAALALRGAGWWAKGYAWFSLLLMLAVVAVGNAVYATNVTLPAQPTRAVVAVTPWVLLLLAFGLLLEMLRYFRRPRPVNGQQREPGQAAAAADPGATAASGTNGAGDSGAGQRAAVTWVAAAGGTTEGRSLPQPRTGLDTLLGPREGEPPAMPGTTHDGAATAEYPGQAAHHGAGHYPDPVAYGEETGYVHPDSYPDHGDYPGAEGYARPGGQDHPGHADEPAQNQPRGEDSAPSPAGAQPAPPAPPGPPASTAEPPAGPQPATERAAKTTESSAETPGKSTETTGNSAEMTGNSAETTGQTTPAETQDPPAPNGDARPPARSVMPLLERLRSTPAPPEE
jgi:hypothetical protein